jgi:hypothetical protein
MEEYVFPENNWYIKITDENKEVLNAWKIKQINYNTPIDSYKPSIKYINYLGMGSRAVVGWWCLITFDEFKKYVLGYEIIKEPANQDYTYLIDMLNR